jgi:hypothetical protein
MTDEITQEKLRQHQAKMDQIHNRGPAGQFGAGPQKVRITELKAIHSTKKNTTWIIVVFDGAEDKNLMCTHKAFYAVPDRLEDFQEFMFAIGWTDRIVLESLEADTEPLLNKIIDCTVKKDVSGTRTNIYFNNLQMTDEVFGKTEGGGEVPF